MNLELRLFCNGSQSPLKCSKNQTDTQFDFDHDLICNMHAILEIWRLSYSFGHWVIDKQQKRPSLVIQSWLLDHWPKHLLQRWPAPPKSLWSLFQPELVQRIKSSLIDQCILFNADLLPQKILFQPVQWVKSCAQLHRRAALTPADGIDIFLKLLQVKRSGEGHNLDLVGWLNFNRLYYRICHFSVEWRYITFEQIIFCFTDNCQILEEIE